MIRIALIGYMGAGKTTVGRILAKTLSLPFYDLDWYIENRMRSTVKQLFDERGEEGFRRIEHNMLHEVAEFENVVLSLGGGTPCFFDNMDYLNQQADTVYLKAEPEVLIQHLKMGHRVRPLLLGKSEDELVDYVKKQIEERESFYKKARYTLDVSLLDTPKKIQQSVDQIIAMVKPTL